jgi:rare lipoprotein A (peptidoglycan hydrolase)
MANLIPIKNIKPSKKINSDSFFGKKIVENLPTFVNKVEENKSTKTKKNLLKNEFILIRKKVIKIDKLLNTFIKIQEKNQENTRKEKESSKRSEKEAKLEKNKDKIGAISFPSLPVGGNFLESIKRFLFFTFLNIALPKLLELLPKLIQFGKSILQATSFLLDIVGGAGKGLLSGLVNFIDWGYKIRDSTEKTIKEIGGDKAAKEFNEFNKKLNTFIDLSILAGLTALDVGLDAEKFRKKKLEEGKVTPKKTGKVSVTEGRGGQKNLGRKAEVTAGKGGARNLGKGAKVTVSGEETGILKNLKGPFAKLKGPLSKFAGAAVPGLGAVVGAADAKARFSSGDNVGGTLASVSASLDALTAGSAILAATGIGAAVPAAFATVSMGIDAVLLIRDILKIFNIPIFKNGGQIELFAEGGRIGTSGRTIKPQRKSFGPKVSKQEITPGKDIGGKQQILKLFPDPSAENIQQTKIASPWWAKWLGLDQNTNAPPSGKPANPYKALKNTAEILNKIPGDLGRLMSAGAMIPLGQKPDRNIGKGFGQFVGKVTQDAIDNNINLSFGDIIKSMSGFANGGDITNQNIVKNSDIGYKVGQVVGKVIESMITSKVNEAVSSIQKEISSIGKPPEEYNNPPGGLSGDDSTPINVNPDEIVAYSGGVAGLISSGRSTGPHIHMENGDGYSRSGGHIPSNVLQNVLVNGKPINSYGTSRDPSTGHEGYDFLTPAGLPVNLTGGLKFVTYDAATSSDNNGNFGDSLIISDDTGRKYLLAHMSKGPKNVASLQQRQQQQQTQNTQQMRPTGNSISGQASWYGPGFQGEKTASGEIFDMNKMTAAMYRPGWGVGSNPFYVEVTNTDNNKRVKVKVNDTGPFAMNSNGKAIYPLRSHPTRIIDLSKAAMNKLGGSGVINVTVQKLGAAAATTAPRSNQNSTLLGVQNSMATNDFGRTSGVGSKGYLIVPGHAAGDGASGEQQLVKKLARNAYNNIKSKNPRIKVQLMDVDSMFPDTDAGWENYLKWVKAKEKEGYEILEVHMDAKNGTGRGVIIPINELNSAEANFSKKYGAYERGYRDLGNPKRGASIFELGNMNDELIRTGGTKQQLDKLTKPLEESILGTQALIAPRQLGTDVAMNMSQTPNITQASLASSQKPQSNLEYITSYAEGQSILLAIQPIVIPRA